MSFLSLNSSEYSPIKCDTSRNDLPLEQTINRMRENERSLSYRELKENFYVSLGSLSNMLEPKYEYVNDYESNCNKTVIRK